MEFRQQSAIFRNTGRFTVALLLVGVLAADSVAAPPSEKIVSPAALENWQERPFSGRSSYRAEDAENGKALHAIANGAASGLCQFVQIDLDSLPVARWSWRLDRAPPTRDERGKTGDDQALRLSFLYQGGADPESILAVQYVWSQSEPVGAAWPNPYVANAYEIVARHGASSSGQWRMERRDLQQDFRATFGRDVARVDAICLMTDGDQTGALVEGWYGDIILQAR